VARAATLSNLSIAPSALVETQRPRKNVPRITVNAGLPLSTETEDAMMKITTALATGMVSCNDFIV